MAKKYQYILFYSVTQKKKKKKMFARYEIDIVMMIKLIQ